MSGAVPKLRFPEFQAPWHSTTFGNMVERVSYPINVDPTATYREIGVRSHGKGVFHKEAALGVTIGEKRVFSVVPETLVLNIVFAWEQAVALTTQGEAGFIASHRFPMFRPKNEKADLRYLLRFLLTKKGKALLELASPGGAGRNKTLGQQDFLKLKTIVPAIAEQRKIASFLGAVDGKISGLRRKEAALVRFKAGLMQKLFSQKLRFTRDDGSAFPEWEKKRFGDLVTWQRSNNLSREFVSDTAGKVQNIHYGDVHGKFSNLFRQSESNAPFISSNAPLAEIKDNDYCRSGDVVIADASEDYADIGKAVEIIETSPKSLVAGLHTHLARPLQGVFALGYAGYMLRAEEVRRQVMREAQGISVLGISKESFGRISVPRPHPDEQRKIADALSAMDAKIAAVRLQISKMETFKKGLLQQMFV